MTKNCDTNQEEKRPNLLDVTDPKSVHDACTVDDDVFSYLH